MSEPDQGWGAWARDVIEMIGVCETVQALDRMRTRQARLLAALQREQPALYASIGEAFGKRGQELEMPAKSSRPGKPVRQPRTRVPSREAGDAQLASA